MKAKRGRGRPFGSFKHDRPISEWKKLQTRLRKEEQIKAAIQNPEPPKKHVELLFEELDYFALEELSRLYGYPTANAFLKALALNTLSNVRALLQGVQDGN